MQLNLIKYDGEIKSEQRFGVHYVHTHDRWMVQKQINLYPRQILTIHDFYGISIHKIDELRFNARMLYMDILEHNHLNNIRALYIEEQKKSNIDYIEQTSADIESAVLIN